MNPLQKIILDYATKNGTKQKFISDSLGLTTSRYNFLKANPRSMNPEEIPIFANFFGFTVDNFIKEISVKNDIVSK